MTTPPAPAGNGWLTRDEALLVAHRMLNIFGPRFKSCQVQGMGTGGKLKVTVFLKPLSSKDIPEPEAFVFSAEDLVPSKIRLP